MLRMQSETGWWLIRHPDHARLAGAFADQWGNDRFRKPEPRARVLHGISCHDDGWAARDAHPSITRKGLPSAFSAELVGKYSAFEEIDLEDYLAVRDRAVRIIAGDDPYAGLLIAMHTFNLLSEHADRSTIAPAGLQVLDSFLTNLSIYMDELRARITADMTLCNDAKWPQTVLEHFRLLQACDNLSLLACVNYAKPAHLLHPLPLNDGSTSEVQVESAGPRTFRLAPWPFAEHGLSFSIKARHVAGHLFESSAQLEDAFHAAHEELLEVRLVG